MITKIYHLFDAIVLWLWDRFEIHKSVLLQVFWGIWQGACILDALIPTFKLGSLISALVFAVLNGISLMLGLLRLKYLTTDAYNLAQLSARHGHLISTLMWIMVFMFLFSFPAGLLQQGVIGKVLTFAIYISCPIYMSLTLALLPPKPPRRKIKLPAIKLAWTPAMVPIPTR